MSLRKKSSLFSLIQFRAGTWREHRRLLDDTPPPAAAFEQRNTVRLDTAQAEQFNVKPPVPASAVSVRTISYPVPDIINTAGQATLPVREGFVSIAQNPDLAWIKVFNRYGRGTVGTGLLQGYSLKQGALASTVSHDSHNLTVIYRDGEAARLAVNALINCGGGISYAGGDHSLTLLPLPVGALMSAAEPEQTAASLDKLEKAFQKANGAGANVMDIVVLALPVVPVLRMSDLGIVDVLAQKIIPLFINTI
jgi:adenine deaminase